MNAQAIMKADHLPLPADAGDPTMLLGDWINTQSETNSLVRASLREAFGRYYLRLFGAGRPDPVDWGEIEIEVNLAGRDQTGFYAVYHLDGIDVHLAANCKLGVLVILSMSSFRDGSGRAGYMERGFFCREPLLANEGMTLKHEPHASEGIDLSSLEGTWRNTDGQAKWLEQVKLWRGPQGWLFSGQPRSEPSALAETHLTAYMDNMGYLGFKAEYQGPYGRLTLAANTQKELIVLTSFHRVGEGCDDRNRVYREFFYRVGDPGGSP